MISVYPKYINAKYWFASLCDDYPDSPLPVLHDERKWDFVAQAIIGIEPFLSAGIPSPYKDSDTIKKEITFETWEDWAKTVYLIMLAQTENNK